MRQTSLAAAAAFVIGGIAMGAVLTHAQPADHQATAPAADQQALDRHPGMGWMGHGGPDRGLNPRDFALIYRKPDRQLAAPDVQKIAEAFLLWNGNHSWKVTNVAPTPDGPIGFSLATPDGAVIATFSMDPHSGKISRSG